MKIEPLDDSHDRTSFSSGVEALDRYFRTGAGQDPRRRVASCYVLTDGSAVPLGFYTLASTSIALANLPTALAARVPRYPIVPATLLGRLAVDAAHRGRGYGRSLLLDALARSLRSDIATYAVVVDPKDDAATGFYAQYGFVPLKSAGPRMFLPIAKAAWLFTG